ncbi:hypothetical protein [Hymenobacter jeollabukensis]|uniref:Uncharacterized protein n=1 Tax=Hymenobacter jeollabukensis TaxID=2025313 RepID=A0A5R8WVK4_9BACT|nr:hypothetical protein [Hymenobacter jeollabukensis]TLM95523.1 hypothetical protein FDY95_06985 [Hymenobacter jeollabukensis]
MARPAALRPAAVPQPGLVSPPVETYYPTIETRLHVAPTAAGLSLFYEAGFGVRPECLRCAYIETAASGRRVLTIEIEYSQELRCPSEL